MPLRAIPSATRALEHGRKTPTNPKLRTATDLPIRNLNTATANVSIVYPAPAFRYQALLQTCARKHGRIRLPIRSPATLKTCVCEHGRKAPTYPKFKHRYIPINPKLKPRYRSARVNMKSKRLRPIRKSKHRYRITQSDTSQSGSVTETREKNIHSAKPASLETPPTGRLTVAVGASTSAVEMVAFSVCAFHHERQCNRRKVGGGGGGCAHCHE